MKSSTKLMYAFWGVALADTVFSNFYFAASMTRSYVLILLFLQLTLIFFWFLQDAADLELRPSPSLRVGVLAVPFVSLPYYLIRYKGFKRALISFGKFFGLLLLMWLIGLVLFSLWPPAGVF